MYYSKDRTQGAGKRLQIPFFCSRCAAWFFLLFVACNLQLITPAHARENRPFLTDMDQFNYAMFLYEQRHYKVAAREFGRVIGFFPGSQITPKAQYMMGEAYFSASDYREAASQFQQFIENFPDNGLKDDASLKLEIARLRLRDEDLRSIPLNLPVEKAPSVLTAPKSATAMRAVQVAMFEGTDYKEVDNELERLKSSGIDTVIIRVFHNKGDRFYPFVKQKGLDKNREGVYFTTQHAPVIEDMLGSVLDMAHRRGLRVFAWMTTRYADYGLGNREELGCKAYDFNTRGIARCRGLDLFNDDAVRHLERLFDDLAKYPIDGILFQDDLILKHNEGFGFYSEALFRRDKGKRLMPGEFYDGILKNSKGGHYIARYTPEFWAWAAWKNRRLLDVAGRLKAVTKKRNLNAKFAINFMYESVSNPPGAMAWLSQSLDEAVKQGFDYYAIMAYHLQMQEELEKEPVEIYRLIEKMTNEAVKIVGEPHRVLIKLQIIDWKTSRPIPDRDVIRLLEMIGDMSDISIAVVPYRKNFPFEELGERKNVSRLFY